MPLHENEHLAVSLISVFSNLLADNVRTLKQHMLYKYLKTSC